MRQSRYSDEFFSQVFRFTRIAFEPDRSSVFVRQVVHALLVVALKPAAERAVIVVLVVDVVLHLKN